MKRKLTEGEELLLAFSAGTDYSEQDLEPLLKMVRTGLITVGRRPSGLVLHATEHGLKVLRALEERKNHETQ